MRRAIGSPVQPLPRSGPERENLREKGQFWTPDWIADAMVAYVVQEGCDHLFDPAVGTGAFFLAWKRLRRWFGGRRIEMRGCEIDPELLRQAVMAGLSPEDLCRVEIRDFTLDPPKARQTAIVANPPYIRHHRIPPHAKRELRAFGARLIGKALDGRAGTHVYFLLRALELLDTNGRLAFIVPADTCEGIFASALWNWITARYRLDGVVTFAAEASPFPDVDTNPVIFMIRNSPPEERFTWIRCSARGAGGLMTVVGSGFRPRSPACGVEVFRRGLDEALATGLSRPPKAGAQPEGPVLGDYARAVRGIATGANEFFFMTRAQARDLRIPEGLLVAAIGRTRDVGGDEVSAETLRKLEAKGRPTLLFSPDGRPRSLFPGSVRDYLKHGEELGLPTRPLIASRNPWYKMEVRKPPPFLFAYLGRRSVRFVRNVAGVVPLTCFLCVYPLDDSPEFVEKLWRVLRHPQTISNLALVGKSYGGGAIKVEPRGLERLALPSAVVSSVGLEQSPVTHQMQLLWSRPATRLGISPHTSKAGSQTARGGVFS